MKTKKKASSPKLDMEEMASLKSWGDPPSTMIKHTRKDAIVDCGWGRLIFGQTYSSNTQLSLELRDEKPGQRDLALYIRDPHVLISKAPNKLFIDPSLTYRLELEAPTTAKAAQISSDGFNISPLENMKEVMQVNAIYRARGMVELRTGYLEQLTQEPSVEILVARDNRNNKVLGCVTGVDHFSAFSDPDNGSSLWALAVDPQCLLPGIGRALVLALAERLSLSGRKFMDLSVMHNNDEAINLYKSLGFYQVPVYCVKTKNAINEQLYVAPPPDENLNIYAQIVIDEARRRGVTVDVIDAAGGFFNLSLGGRTICCRESLTELTSAIALSRCDDKSVTRKLLLQADLCVPEQVLVDSAETALAFLKDKQRIVIKPVRGEQGNGVFVDLQNEAQVIKAYQSASELCDKVIAETYVHGDDLRIIVINDEVVAAAVRKPATIVGDGIHTIDSLIQKQSRRRMAATHGESSIPIDDETNRCIKDAGYSMDQTLPAGETIRVRKTANLHTGGTLHDVTDILHQGLKNAALTAAKTLQMPLVGLDFIVQDVRIPEYHIIEANERPGLANHEPQPTTEKMLDMLFPQTTVND